MALHAFNALNRNILYDTQSEAVLAVDALVYDLIRLETDLTDEEKIEILSDRYEAAAVKEAIGELNSLYEEGLLRTESSFAPVQKPVPVIKAMCLHVAHDCDLRCKYCFASQGDFKGSRELMDLETGKKALDFLVAGSGNRRNLEVDFFGGEPLLNFEVVKELTLYGEKLNRETGKNIRFTLTTNGVLLDDDKIEFINRHMSNVVMSLDGRKEVHDRMRPTRNGKGSYDHVLEKFKKLIAARGEKDSFIRGTFTGYNLDFDKDVLHFFDEGFKTVSMEPVVTDDRMDYAIREEHLPEVLEGYERLAEAYLQRRSEDPDLRFFHFLVDLQSGPCLAKKRMGCGAGVEYISVTPSGELYPCHQFVGEKEFLIGTLDEGIQNEELVRKFSEADIDHKESCQSCWNQNFCSGGCHANAWFHNRSLTEPYAPGCEMQKKRSELALGLHAAEACE